MGLPATTSRDRADQPLIRYAVAVAVTLAAVLSQYFVPVLWPVTQPVYHTFAYDLLIVYGIPIVAFALLVGSAPLRNWRAHPRRAAWEGLRWYGLLSLLALAITIVLVLLYEALYPAALQLLQRENPALRAAAGDPWFFIGFSFVIGAIEETIFRGWIFGFFRNRSGSWWVAATWTSALFAGTHLYYGTTYGAASPIIFPSLFLLGFALAATYRASGGNLVVPALLHGANDAFAFLTLVSNEAGLLLRFLLIGIGVVVGLIHFLRWGWEGRPTSETPAWGPT
jgi:membrane protease YdiL (CAAX protease family)